MTQARNDETPRMSVQGYVSPEVHDRLHQIARETGESVSQIISHLATAFVDEEVEP